MIQVYDCEQGSEEWFRARMGIPTASEFATVMAKGKGSSPSKTRRTYMLKLLGERLTEEPMDTYSNHHMERGKIMEAEAADAYQLIADTDCSKVGFIRNGDKGASPDLMAGSNGVVEIKSKLPHILLDILFSEQMPPEHMAQVQGQIWVAEREWCDFVCYWPKLRTFVKRVYRDEKYINQLAGEVARFNDELRELELRYAA